MDFDQNRAKFLLERAIEFGECDDLSSTLEIGELHRINEELERDRLFSRNLNDGLMAYYANAESGLPIYPINDVYSQG